MLVARTQVKDIMKESGLGVENISADYMDRLDEKVRILVKESVQRAKENGRRTVMSKDL